MAQLIVRNIDDALIRAVKKRAARHNHSAEQEHREILQQALLGPQRRSLAEVLAKMPNSAKTPISRAASAGGGDGECISSTPM